MAVQITDPFFIPYIIAHAPNYGLVLDYFLFCNDSFRIAPPLTITEEEILLATRQLKKLLDDAEDKLKIK
jgi:acetylornithine/succinyldiaminopimelate/putrescine aminotransferase